MANEDADEKSVLGTMRAPGGRNGQKPRKAANGARSQSTLREILTPVTPRLTHPGAPTLSNGPASAGGLPLTRSRTCQDHQELPHQLVVPWCGRQVLSCPFLQPRCRLIGAEMRVRSRLPGDASAVVLYPRTSPQLAPHAWPCVTELMETVKKPCMPETEKMTLRLSNTVALQGTTNLVIRSRSRPKRNRPYNHVIVRRYPTSIGFGSGAQPCLQCMPKGYQNVAAGGWLVGGR